MGNRFSSGKNSIAECDICGFRYMLSQLRPLTIKTKITNILACDECWNEDHPQLQLGMYPVEDPQAVRNPRPDNSYDEGGFGSRIVQWGWNPVGGSRSFDSRLTPNNLVMRALVNSVTVTVS